MRKIPIFTIIAALLLGAGYLYYNHEKSKVEVSFNYIVDKKTDDYQVKGRIDGAGDTIVTLSLSKDDWNAVKTGQHYNIKAVFYDKNKLSDKQKQKLDGPFWSNEANQGLLVNDVDIEQIEALDY
ncbi:hypothetical protein [Listeria costaricensis]|uniref:hypothetical protein n=1 Tax=Listeria costaricensis TaxID=2026604 RepID=UPI000C084D4E